MADFRKPPDFEQPADRHTPLVDPVVTVRQLSRWGFARRALTRIEHALVFSTSKGDYDEFLPPVRPRRSEAAARRYTAVYEVDMGVHPHRAEIPLPSDNDAFEFAATIELSWQVTAPKTFVRSGHRDVPALLLGELQQAARSLTRSFAIHDSARAEAELLRVLTDPERPPLGATVGLKVVWTLRLSRDQQEIEHRQRLQAIDHATAEQIRTEQLGRDYDAELDRRARRQDELQMERATEYGRMEHELSLQRQEWQQDQERLRAQHQAELLQLEAEKIAFYQKYLEEGGVVAWALQLATRPEDIQLVVKSMHEDQLRLVQAKMDLAKELLGGDNLEEYEREAPKRLALNAVYEIFNQRLPGVPRDRASSPPLTPHTEVSLAKQNDDAPPASDPEPTAPANDPVDKPIDKSANEKRSGTFADWQPPPGYGSSPAGPSSPTEAQESDHGVPEGRTP
ncbi:hypothetical protein SAMN04487981_103435 [Streptomyces sp. cf386]|uniref:hypothetical protein n=1 Tax=Streptomyces sp. cf386 TaxID=1761904 RepID=UPI00088BF2D7|nr:hypothetical protein [Streptomyces sp. cf386]SDN06585.1 hypothetical protein SAMN04487981_103435 [Streptomyces sp. cf386]